jgi:hypothetical protein
MGLMSCKWPLVVRVVEDIVLNMDFRSMKGVATIVVGLHRLSAVVSSDIDR